MARWSVKHGLFFLIASLAYGATAGSTDRYIPLVQDGGGWTTEVMIVNLSDHTATVVASFLTAAGYSAIWPIGLTASTGKVLSNEVGASLVPGGILRIQSKGEAGVLTRGFAEIYSSTPGTQLGAFARLVRKIDDQVVQTFTVPFAPVNEQRSRLPLDLTRGAAAEFVWVSMTTAPVLDLTFRDISGEVVVEGQITLNSAQTFLNPLELWPQLVGFSGVMEWNVSFPAADRYEYRTLAAISLWTREAGAIFAIPGMTLAVDQDNGEPYR